MTRQFGPALRACRKIITLLSTYSTDQDALQIRYVHRFSRHIRARIALDCVLFSPVGYFVPEQRPENGCSRGPVLHGMERYLWGVGRSKLSEFVRKNHYTILCTYKLGGRKKKKTMDGLRQCQTSSYLSSHHLILPRLLSSFCSFVFSVWAHSQKSRKISTHLQSLLSTLCSTGIHPIYGEELRPLHGERVG